MKSWSNGERTTECQKGDVLTWTLFHSEAARLGEYVHRRVPGWDWGKPFDASILDG